MTAERTPLYEEHVRLGAQMTNFGGWLMPLQYTSIREEHRAVREAVDRVQEQRLERGNF